MLDALDATWRRLQIGEVVKAGDYFKLETKFGNVYVHPNSATEIYIDANHNIRKAAK